MRAISEFEFRPAGIADLDQAVDAIQQAFRYRFDGGVEPEPGEGPMFDDLYHRPGFDATWVKVALYRGRIASVLSMFPRPSYIDGCVVDSWILSPAATLREYRGMGLLPRLMQMTLDDLAERRCSLVYFHGVPTYYSRFGFTRVMPFFRTEALVAMVPHRHNAMRPAEERDIPGIAALYDRQARSGFLAPLRDEKWWRAELSLGLDPELARRMEHLVLDPRRVMVLDSGGVIGAYAVLDVEGSTLIIRESACAGPEAAEATMRSVAAIAEQEGLESLRTPGNPRNPLARALYETGGNVTCRYPQPSFARIIHLKKLLQELQPALAQRYATAGLDWTGSIDLGGRGGCARLRVSPRAVEVGDGCPEGALPLDESQLVRMVCGYTPPMDSSPVPEMPQVDPHTRAALRALFPSGCPSPSFYSY